MIVTPAQAELRVNDTWVPACAGMTSGRDAALARSILNHFYWTSTLRCRVIDIFQGIPYFLQCGRRFPLDRNRLILRISLHLLDACQLFQLIFYSHNAMTAWYIWDRKGSFFHCRNPPLLIYEIILNYRAGGVDFFQAFQQKAKDLELELNLTGKSQRMPQRKSGRKRSRRTNFFCYFLW